MSMNKNASKRRSGKCDAPEAGVGLPSPQMELKRSPKGSTKQHRQRQVALAPVSKETRTDAPEKRKFVSEFQPGVEFQVFSTSSRM